VGITMAELPGMWRGIRDRAAFAVIPAADAMGRSFQDEVKRRLTERSHARGTRTPSPAGSPPAMESGQLAGSVAMIPASTPVIARSYVGPHRPPRDWVNEYGLDGIRPMRAKYMRFFYDGLRFEQVVNVPERSYIRSTVELMVADGSLTRVAAEAFYAYLWG
jgi:hypothetical protein